MTELPKINISNPLDELFSTEEERQSSQQERIVTIDCKRLTASKNTRSKLEIIKIWTS